MTFYAPGGLISLNVLVDSVDSEHYRVVLYAYYSKNINPDGSDITVGYVNGMADIFVPVYVTKNAQEQTYVEYYLKGGNYSKLLKTLDFEYLKFGHIVQIKKITTPKYFKNFLKRY